MEPQFSQLDQSTNTLTRFECIASGGLAIALIALLGVAAALTPDASGTGTHQQLGLPPCTMKYLLGIRCMGCGMTTSWAHTMNGELRLALAASVSGFLLCLLSMVAVPVLLAFAISARRVRSRSLLLGLKVVLVVVVLICVSEWLIRLALG